MASQDGIQYVFAGEEASAFLEYNQSVLNVTKHFKHVALNLSTSFKYNVYVLY